MSEREEYIPTRQSLLSRLKNWDDHESWKTFFDTYWKLIYNTAMRSGLTDAEAQDVVQETVLSVMKSMPNFKYDAQNGSFKAWLKRLTSWRVMDELRKRKHVFCETNRQDTSTGQDFFNTLPDPAMSRLEAAWDEEWEKNLLDAAIDRLKAKVDSKQYQIFDLHVIKGWPVMRVAGALGINPGRVYLSKHRIGKLLKTEIEQLREKPI
jgi:RNA polymerase sigma factor (sigma-70 family)